LKSRYVRRGGELTDMTVVVVRGGDLDAPLLAADARRSHAVYGVYAISVFAADGVTVDELAQEPPLVRFERLTWMTVGALRRVGLTLRPTGRNPRHHSIEFNDLEEGIARLVNCEHRSMVNPYHQP
jgi:hypothetical protein